MCVSGNYCLGFSNKKGINAQQEEPREVLHYFSFFPILLVKKKIHVQYLFDSPLYVLNQTLCCMALGNRKKKINVTCSNELGTILCSSIYSLSMSVIISKSYCDVISQQTKVPVRQ